MPMNRIGQHGGRRRSRRSGAAAAALAVTILAAGCDLGALLDVEAASRIPAADLEDPSKAALRLSGAIADFECALGSYIVLGGIVSKELMDTSPTADRWPYERRHVLASDARYATFGCEALGVYTPLSTARWSADEILRLLEGWTDEQMPQGANRTLMIATAAAYAGYAYTLMGEGFCSAAFDQGPERTPQQVFTLAEQRFTRAIEAAQTVGAEAAPFRNMALVGRARARLNLSQWTPAKLPEAAADAALVPAGFARVATASTVSGRRENRVFRNNNSGSLTTVHPQYRGLTLDGVPDTRVTAVDAGRNATDGTRIWEQRKYAGLAAPLPLATWREAQLILAEAAARAGDPEGAAAAINRLRTLHSLPAYDGGTAEEVLAQVIEERRRELFLEGHRLYDINRLDLPLDPAPGTVFVKGGTYGSTRCYPLPNIERLNNPNIP
jgi:starch-binding outer membrane protein, SusD/RagB family